MKIIVDENNKTQVLDDHGHDLVLTEHIVSITIDLRANKFPEVTIVCRNPKLDIEAKDVNLVYENKE